MNKRCGVVKSALKTAPLTQFFKPAISTATPKSPKSPKAEGSPKKRESKKTQKELYTLPKSYHITHDNKDGRFKNGLVNIWHWNINGLNAVLTRGNLQDFIDRTNPDILCFNETKIDEEKLFKLKIHEYMPTQYQQYWNCSKGRKGYSGVAILSKVAPLKVEYDIGIEEHDQEGRVLTAEFKDFVVVSVYVPNVGLEGLKRLDYRVQQFDKDFHNYLENLMKTSGKPVIVAGDLNVALDDIDVYDPKRMEGTACFTKEERESFQSLLDRGFVDTFRYLNPGVTKYSFWGAKKETDKKIYSKFLHIFFANWTILIRKPLSFKFKDWAARGNDMRGRDHGWRLDYMLIDKANAHRIIDSTIHKEFVGSDHCPIQLKLDLGEEAMLTDVDISAQKQVEADSIGFTQASNPQKGE